MTQTHKMAVAGAAGRMGRQLLQAIPARGHMVTGGTEAPGSDDLGADLGLLSGSRPSGLLTVADLNVAAQGADVWLDFTQPEATLSALRHLPGLGVRAAIIGTTGFSASQTEMIAHVAENMAIVKAGNFSDGVNLLQALVRQAAQRLGAGWDIEILETHHRHKRDAPSGTALMLGESAAQGRGVPFEDMRRAPYDGPDAKRAPGAIGFSVRRSGGVIGAHTVSFGSEHEELCLSHTALDRSVFAEGAITAADWAVAQPPGLYDMNDVLGLGRTD